MAKIHNNAEKFPIEWDGDVKKGNFDGDNVPSSVDIQWGGGGTRQAYVPCWDNGSGGKDPSQCTDDLADYFFEDFDISEDGIINSVDTIAAVAGGAPGDFISRIIAIALGSVATPPNGPRPLVNVKSSFTWGDVNFIQEVMDGIGTGSRKARQDRLNKILDDEDKKKRLIRLICRIKGEKVYDDVTEVGSVQVDINDVELVSENIIGKVKLEIKSGI